MHILKGALVTAIFRDICSPICPSLLDIFRCACTHIHLPKLCPETFVYRFKCHGRIWRYLITVSQYLMELTQNFSHNSCVLYFEEFAHRSTCYNYIKRHLHHDAPVTDVVRGISTSICLCKLYSEAFSHWFTFNSYIQRYTLFTDSLVKAKFRNLQQESLLTSLCLFF